MSKPKKEYVVEDPKRRLLDVCRHRAPACWSCVARDMERQRDDAEKALRAFLLSHARGECRCHLCDEARCVLGSAAEAPSEDR